MDIIFVADYGWGGMGDMVRCMLSLYAFTQHVVPGTGFFIDFDTHRPDLKPFFCVMPYPAASSLPPSSDCTNIRLYAHDKQAFLDAFYPLQNKNTNHTRLLVTANFYDLVDDVTPWIHEFRRSILAPSPLVMQMMDAYEPYHHPYISVHIRFGDYTIQGTPGHYTEKRLDSSSIDALIDCVNTCTRLHTRHPNHTIFIHSDCQAFKDKLIKTLPFVHQFTTTTSHTAEDVVVMMVDDKDSSNTHRFPHASTVAEFFFIAGASHVVQLFHYSGFAHLAAIYGQTRFYHDHSASSSGDDIFRYLGPPIPVSSLYS